MDNGIVQYMHDNGWPMWAIAVVLFFLATGRSIVNAGSILFNRKRREQDASNLELALGMAREAITRSEKCEQRDQECRSELALIRIENEHNRIRIAELTVRVDKMTPEAAR